MRLVLVALCMASVAASAVAASPSQSCQSGKNKAAGQYADCRQKAEAKLALTGNETAYGFAIGKCAMKYAAKWALIEAKANGACPSNGDEAAIQGAIDTHTTAVAAALAGGALPDCPGDLATCQADFDTCVGELATCMDGLQSLVLKTGQTGCWDAVGAAIPCAGTGQDGELQKGLARSYVDNGDGTITDQRTGLMWEKLSDDGTIHDKDTAYTWTDAFSTKVAMLNAGSFAGFTDWRVPNVNELQSLVNYGAAYPAINAAFNANCAATCSVLTCSCTQPSASWSSSTYLDIPSNAWVAYFQDGSVVGYLKANSGYVRAVRGGS